MPDLYIIAGPNGAGKTTASMTILPDVLHIKEFINADAIAAGISPFNVESVAFQAGRIMLDRIQQLIKENKSFAFETTLSTRSYLKVIEHAKTKGYSVTLLFFWLNSAELAKLRVATRVKQGGHNIPSNVIDRRYFRGIHNLLNDFIHLCNNWGIYDNSESEPKPICWSAQGELEVIDQITYQSILRYVKSR
jgi:predicted ABC-type ATPase